MNRTAVALGTGTALTLLGYWAGFGSRSQVFGSFPYQGVERGSAEEPLVALTFDDGPNEPYTSALLDTLDEHDVHATFFQVGRCAERYPDVTRRVVDSGHVLAGHSYSHSLTSYLREPGQDSEIERGQQALHRIAGVRPALYRPPWLCHWPSVLGGIRRHDLQVVSGTFGHPLEVFQPPAARLAAGAARRATPGAMLILHDGREARGGPRGESVEAVGPLIRRLRAAGYGFTTVDRLLGVRPYL